MFYIIQENTFKESNYNKVIESVERLGLEYDIVKSVGFTDLILKGDTPNNVEINENSEYVYRTDRKDVFVFGSLKLARCAKNQNWSPGSLSNNNHDYDVYKNYYKDELLNYDSKIVSFDSEFEWNTKLKFIRPCEDTKVFTGTVYDESEWKDNVKKCLTNGHTTVLNKDTRIQVSSVKKIYKEIRFWVVGGKVISGSQYVIGGVAVTNGFVEPEAYEYAQKMVDIFQLAEAFVIDICLTNGENDEPIWKIVEAGCINCAGFYNADLNKVIMALEDHFDYKSTFEGTVIDGIDNELY